MLGFGLKLGIGRKLYSADNSLLNDFDGLTTYAYSLGYLFDSYTSDVILVQRGGDNAEEGFTPSEITNGTLQAFVNAGNGEGYVKTKYDQSGNGNNSIQNTQANMGKIVTSGSIITNPGNGLPAIYYSGGSQGDSVTFLSSDSPPTTKFIVARSDNSSNNQILSGSPNSAARHQVTYLISNGGELSMFAGATFTPSSITSLFNTTFLCYSLFNGASSQLGVNGNIVDTGNAGAQNNEGYQMPTSFGFRGYWQLDIYFDSNQSANRTSIETAINSYYSIY